MERGCLSLSFSVAPAPLGPRYSLLAQPPPVAPLGGIGSQQEVDFARDQKKKKNLGYQWKEGDCTENIRGVDAWLPADTSLTPSAPPQERCSPGG